MHVEPAWIYPPAPSLAVFTFLVFFTAGLFLLSGLCVTIPLMLKNKVSTKYFLILSLLASCAVGYVSFLLFTLNPLIGKVFIVTMYAAIGALLIYLSIAIYKRKISQKKIDTLKYFAAASLLVVMISGFCNAVLYSCTAEGIVTKKIQYCSIIDDTFDNTLPLTFAHTSYRGINDALVSDWKATDRPPLQSGIMVFQLPVLDRIERLVNGYQILAVFLQCMWIFAFLEFIKRTDVKASRVPSMFLMGVTSTFIFFNSVFVWPKMLAAVLGVFSFIIIFDAIRDKKISQQQIFIASSGITLGMLAHGGLIFTVIPISLYGVWMLRKYITIKRTALIAGIIIILYLPWMIYKSHNSSGDRLVNWWISGKVEPDIRPVQEVLIEAYANTSIGAVIASKAGNVAALAGFLEYTGPVSTKDSVGTIANLESSFFIPSFSFSLVGLVLIIRDFVFKRSWFGRIATKASILRASLIVSGASVVLWVLLSFGPPNAPTVAYAGSYATFLILYFTLTSYLAKYKIITTIAILSGIYFIVTTAILFGEKNATINLQYVALAGLAAGLSGLALRLLTRSGSAIVQKN